MSAFDYNRFKVVGIVHQKPMTTNAAIKVIGYLDTSAKFERLSPDEARDLFSPRGEVFAHNLLGSYQSFNLGCICFSVKPNENSVMTNPDSFIWDKSGDIYEYAYKIAKLDDAFISVASPSATYKNLQGIKIQKKEEDGYFISGGKLFRAKDIHNTNYILPYWDLKNIVEAKIKNNIYFNSKGDPVFVFGSLDSSFCSYLDMMPQDLLASNFLRDVVLPSSDEIISDEKLSQYITAMHPPKEVFSQRMKRLTHILKHHELTCEQLKALAKNVEFRDCINECVDKNMQAFVEERHKDIEQELEAYKNNKIDEINSILAQDEKALATLHKKINNLDEEYKEKHSSYEKELNTIISVIEKRQEELASMNDSFLELEQKKERIVDDFSVIREVLSMSPSTNEKNQTKLATYVMEQINKADNPYGSLQLFSISLQEQLAFNKLGKAKAKDICKLLSAHYILLLPDIKIVNSIINASGQATYILQHVTPQWQNYECLWEGGLANIIEHCSVAPEEMHYMVLQQVNLSYLPCFLQPLVNIEMGMAHVLPNNVSLPTNIRILCTPTSEKGLPLAASCLKYMGCFPKDDYASDSEIEETNSVCILTPKLLGNIKGTATSSDYSSYIDDDE